MDSDERSLIRKLRDAGLSQQAIDAAWPAWWSTEASNTKSGQAELRFTLARKLGLLPKPLLGERVVFTWKDAARFKNLSVEDEAAQAALTSFGIAIGQILLRATPEGKGARDMEPRHVRHLIVQARGTVDLAGLLVMCWALGVPVIHLRVFPLTGKRMHAMVVEAGGRSAVLLGRDAEYPAPIAFTLAHEIGHVALGHISSGTALVDMSDVDPDSGDSEERQADRFALSVLTASDSPDIRPSASKFTARSLARAVLRAGADHQIEPGTLALCLGYQTNAWQQAIGSLRYIYTEAKPVWREVNRLAEKQIQWESLADDSAEYLRNVMALNDV